MATHRILAFLLPPAAMLFAPGCADQGSFPSLAPRPVERLSNDEPVRTAPAVAADPQLRARVVELLSQVQQGDAAFQAVLPAARATAGRAGASGSEAWIEAQQAISRLEAARAPSTVALAQFHRLSVERAAVPTNADDFATLLAAIEQAEAIVTAQQTEINRLRSRLQPI